MLIGEERAGGYYISREELAEIINERYKRALRRASLEAFEGRFDESELAHKVDEEHIKKQALKLIVDK